MTVESVTFITDLNSTNPAGTDPKSEGDDHIRNIKTGLDGTFPNFAGIAMTSTEAELNLLDGVTATTAELNYTDGVTSNIQTQMDLKAPLASPSLTGNPTAPTQTSGDNSTKLATTAYADSAGGMVLLDTQTASSSGTIDLTTGIDSTYDNYLIKISGLVPASNGFDLLMQISIASTFKSDALYYWGLNQIHQGGANVPLGDVTDTSIKIGDSLPNTAANALRYDINFSNPDSTVLYKTFDGSGSGFQTTNGISGYTSTGYYLNTAAIDGIRFLMSSGDIASGVFRLYGIKN